MPYIDSILPGKLHGWRSSGGHKELATTEHAHRHRQCNWTQIWLLTTQRPINWEASSSREETCYIQKIQQLWRFCPILVMIFKGKKGKELIIKQEGRVFIIFPLHAGLLTYPSLTWMLSCSHGPPVTECSLAHVVHLCPQSLPVDLLRET